MDYPLPKDPEYQAKLVIVDKDYVFTKYLVLAAIDRKLPVAAFLDFHKTLDYAHARREQQGELTNIFLIEPLLRNCTSQINPEPHGAELALNLYAMGVRPEQIIFQSLCSLDELVQANIFTPKMNMMYKRTFIEKIPDIDKIFSLIERLARQN